ncbi:hydrogenase nickel incorporation protein HypA [Anaerobacillus arseniciselenatis]|uniref:Hydrogenase nickel incorporation protein HypA n=1 Tax=Anaerobacillus arseniciselenatis TaxID=85682 RepID=A0A1S2LVU1_9BACI|nr:hydrogenase maturation nickel metallochaperone HypA [Anaerobacillus arseniciselenatis]OIJ15777.1 hydrogenase nickel incorporation protein HypA [Anaerobacillus arseniciselenatis]
MHEMALMGDILKIIGEDVQKRNFSKVEKIELIVGEVSNAMPDALEMALEIYKTQSIPFLDKNTKLVIINEEAKARCCVCESEYIPEKRLSVCPTCCIPSGELISGETFKVYSYEGS